MIDNDALGKGAETVQIGAEQGALQLNLEMQAGAVQALQEVPHGTHASNRAAAPRRPSSTLHREYLLP